MTIDKKSTPQVSPENIPKKESNRFSALISVDSNIGLKPEKTKGVNQDALSAYYPGLTIVADGVGGNDRGDYASKLLCYLCRNPDYFVEDVLKVHRNINSASSKMNKPCATTMVAAIEDLGNINHYKIYNVGDSPAIIFDTLNNTYSEITIRDEEGNENEKKRITQAIGGGLKLSSQNIHCVETTLESGQYLVLSTDGFSDYLDRGAISYKDVMKILRESPDTSASEMVQRALKCGGKDNVTVAVLGHHQ